MGRRGSDPKRPLFVFAGSSSGSARQQPAPPTARARGPSPKHTRTIPHAAATGSEFVRQTAALSEAERRAVDRRPAACRQPARVFQTAEAGHAARSGRGGRTSEITICVTPDYLALGSDTDFLRMPMGAADRVRDRGNASASCCRRRGWSTPSTSRRSPPATAAAAARSRDALERLLLGHKRRIREQRLALHAPLGASIAGQKKDLVVTNRLLAKSPGGSRSTAGIEPRRPSSRSARCTARAMPTTATACAWSAPSPTSTASRVRSARRVAGPVAGRSSATRADHPLASLIAAAPRPRADQDNGCTVTVRAACVSCGTRCSGPTALCRARQAVSPRVPRSCSSESPGGSSRGSSGPSPGCRASRARASGTSPRAPGSCRR